MNKIFYILSAFLLIAYGCNKAEENIPDSMPAAEILANDDISMTSEVSKIETIYEEGMEKIEGEDDGLPKIETVAPPEMIDKLWAELQKSVSKQVSYAKNSGNLVGVFRGGQNCGQYSSLTIHLDCEDKKPKTSTSGNIGASNVNSGKNVVLEVCMVDNKYFSRTTDDYAILNLTSQIPSGVGYITRYFDTENNRNKNSVKINGIDQKLPKYIGSNLFHTDIILQFYYYRSASLTPATTASAFPSLGISYHVLGTFGTNTGEIYFDDEDDNNNKIEAKEWNGSGLTAILPLPGRPSNEIFIDHIMDAYGNTKFYFSKVN